MHVVIEKCKLLTLITKGIKSFKQFW